MKVSTLIDLSNLLVIKKSLLENINDILFSEKTIFQTYSVDKVFTEIKKAGVDGIELLIPLRNSDQDINKAKKIIKRYIIPVLSIHQSLSSITNISLNEIIRLCEIANLFSAKIITLHAGALGSKLYDDSFINMLKSLQKKYGVTFGIENMPRSPFFFGKGYTYKSKEFSSLLRNNNLSITFDTTHLGQVGDDMLEFYSTNKQQIVDIHLSDYKTHWINRKLLLYKDTHLPLLKGELPIEKFLLELKKNHYSGLITLEINDTLEELCNSIKIVKSS